jgi:hypothetical protein
MRATSLLRTILALKCTGVTGVLYGPFGVEVGVAPTTRVAICSGCGCRRRRRYDRPAAPTHIYRSGQEMVPRTHDLSGAVETQSEARHVRRNRAPWEAALRTKSRGHAQKAGGLGRVHEAIAIWQRPRQLREWPREASRSGRRGSWAENTIASGN